MGGSLGGAQGRAGGLCGLWITSGTMSESAKRSSAVLVLGGLVVLSCGLSGCGGDGEVEVQINPQNSVVLPGSRLKEPPLAQDVAKGRVLLQQLASGRKKVQNLTTEERRILNRLDRTLASMEEEK